MGQRFQRKTASGRTAFYTQSTEHILMQSESDVEIPGDWGKRRPAGFHQACKEVDIKQEGLSRGREKRLSEKEEE